MESSAITMELVVGTGVSEVEAPLMQDLLTGSKVLPAPHVPVLSEEGAHETSKKGIKLSKYVFTIMDPFYVAFSYRII